MFTLLWGLLLWVMFVVISFGVLLVVYVPILLPAFLITPFLGPEAAEVVWLIALVLRHFWFKRNAT